MRVPVSWLRELVEVDAPTSEIAERLSLHGAAVEDVETTGGIVSGVVVAEVREVADAAGSDKLCVAQLDAGEAGKFQVVAGAKNFSAGDRVPLAAPGARVTTLDVPVGVRTMMKTYESQGMLCSARELGVSEEHEGILVLEPEAPLGADVSSYLHLDDEVLAFEIYPNRPDLMSVVGIAREVAVLYDAPLRFPTTDVVEAGPAASSLTSVEVEDPEGCPRYLARVVQGIGPGSTPPLVQARLTACGLRPLGPLVDATNYVLLMLGQPLHAFDLDRLGEERIVVRRARAGEKLEMIDGSVVDLEAADLVIADGVDAQAIAGVMGGAATEVGPETRRVLLESAHFEPIGVSRTARRLHLLTEAASRFERGSDPEAVDGAADLAAELMRRWCGAEVATGSIDVGEAPGRRHLALRPERVTHVLGAEVPEADIDRYLAGLGCELGRDGAAFAVTVPSWRPDLEREIDLVEEVARLHGYERFPVRQPPAARGFLEPTQRLRRRVRDVLVGAGLIDTLLYSFSPQADLDALGYEGALVEVTNPMTVEQRWLRPSLVPGLLRAGQRNSAVGVRSQHMFEVGTVFRGWEADADLPTEAEMAAVVRVGEAGALAWYSQPRPVDAFDVKGVVELILGELGIQGWQIRAGGPGFLHSGRAATVLVEGSEVGYLGELRPSVAAAFELEGAAAVAELELSALWEHVRDELTMRPLSRQPPVLRDLAIAVADEVAASSAERVVAEHGGEHLESVTLMDVYRGAQVGPGRKSLAFRLVFRAHDRTLTADEADTARAAIVEACARELEAEAR